MNMKKIVLAMAMSSAMIAGANAADQGHGKITFEGTVIEAACSINPDSLDQTVSLGSIARHQLLSGGKSTPRDFSIKLEDCDAKIGSNAEVTFNGPAGDQGEGLDKTFATTGVAAGTVGVVITQAGGVIVEPNKPATAIALNDGENELAFQAYAQGGTTTVATGAFSATANFVMNYK
ncbi:Fimbria A protein precursor [Cedecea davisae]|uniref:Putative PRS fimbrial major pilin protein n=1 Tax=Cedecea davisae DSM 4568 TaxID=566551 RepID=S3IXS6_9ENTR|nr:fimbrial protein [Cedecea davisae]EPF17720.1 putative PRS fimbrial major pilin protein [Cedecea davisae DSM 4568]SUX28057.1 Fimbria A protein precursor [Cedecea davisae]